MSRWICPHCESEATRYATRLQTKLVRDSYYACENVECRHTFLARTEIVATICPALEPAADVKLPMSARFRAKPPATLPTPANDGEVEEVAEA